jgi:hypothetical protein
MQAVHPSAVVAREETPSRRGLQRIGGAAGVIFGAVDLAAAVILLTSFKVAGFIPPIAGKEGQFADFLRTMLPVVLPLMFAETAAAILALVFVRAIDERLRPFAPTASPIVAVIGYAGLVILMLDFASFVSLEQDILGGLSRQQIAGMVPAWQVLADTAGVVGGLLSVTWLVMINWIASRRGGYPKALGYAGLIAALVAFVGLMLQLHGFTHILANLWEIAIGVVLWRGAKSIGSPRVADLP